MGHRDGSNNVPTHQAKFTFVSSGRHSCVSALLVWPVRIEHDDYSPLWDGMTLRLWFAWQAFQQSCDVCWVTPLMYIKGKVLGTFFKPQNVGNVVCCMMASYDVFAFTPAVIDQPSRHWRGTVGSPPCCHRSSKSALNQLGHLAEYSLQLHAGSCPLCCLVIKGHFRRCCKRIPRKHVYACSCL